MAELIEDDNGRAEWRQHSWSLRDVRSWSLRSVLRTRDHRRMAAVFGAAVLTGSAAVIAIGEEPPLNDPTVAASRIDAQLIEPDTEPVASTVAAEPRALARDGSVLVIDDGDEQTTSTAADDDTTTTDDDTTTTGDDTTTTDDDTTSSASTATTGESSTSTSASTQAATDDTTTTRATSSSTDRSSSTADQTTTTRRTTTTAGQTTTTRPPTTTTRPPTTTTQPPTTQPPTTQPPATTAGNTCASGAEFELVMRDDFNGSSIGGQWFVWNGSAGNAGNGMRYASQLSVSNGRLLLEAEMVNGVLQSGGMNHTHSQTYGKYRFRVRTDVDPSRAMSGVILTWPTAGDHLRNGENNAYETLPHQDSPTRSPFYSFIHKPFASNSGQQEFKIWQADAAQWQTMTMEWTPNRISITRDGGETWTVNETGADLIPDVPHRFHIQLDAFKQSMGSRVTMEVDFAEVYRYCG